MRAKLSARIVPGFIAIFKLLQTHFQLCSKYCSLRDDNDSSTNGVCTAMRLLLLLLAALFLQACGPAEDCSDAVGTWKGAPGVVVVRKVAAKRYAVEFPGSGRSLDMQCHAGVLAGESPIRGSINAAGKLVLDGFPGGVIETFSKTD
jgi:hypothetical protein